MQTRLIDVGSENTCSVTVRPAHQGPLSRRELTPAIIARFQAKFNRSHASDCWPWMAHCAGGGYGRFKIAGRYRQASNVAWVLAHGRALPVSKLIRHTCDNPRCVNPAHLRAATQRHNVLDAIRKGRHVNPDWRLRRHIRNQHTGRAA